MDNNYYLQFKLEEWPENKYCALPVDDYKGLLRNAANKIYKKSKLYGRFRTQEDFIKRICKTDNSRIMIGIVASHGSLQGTYLKVPENQWWFNWVSFGEHGYFSELFSTIMRKIHEKTLEMDSLEYHPVRPVVDLAEEVQLSQHPAAGDSASPPPPVPIPEIRWCPKCEVCFLAGDDLENKWETDYRQAMESVSLETRFISSGLPTWVVETGSGSWTAYSYEAVKVLEEAVKQGKTKVEFTGKWKGNNRLVLSQRQASEPIGDFDYTVNFQDHTNMVQKNIKYNTERRVYRSPILDPCRTGFNSFTLDELKGRAKALGASDQLDRLDSLDAELAGMKLGELKKRARSIGTDDVSVDKLDDADDPKAAAIELILRAEAIELVLIKLANLRGLGGHRDQYTDIPKNIKKKMELFKGRNSIWVGDLQSRELAKVLIPFFNNEDSSPLLHEERRTYHGNEYTLQQFMEKFPSASEISLAEWLEGVRCAELGAPLNALGVESVEDLRLLESAEIATLVAPLEQIPALNFLVGVGKLKRAVGSPDEWETKWNDIVTTSTKGCLTENGKLLKKFIMMN